MKCHSIHLTLNNILKADPSRTTVLRAMFVRDMDKRFNALKRDIRISIVPNDCFGIQPGIQIFAPLPPKAFQFLRTPQKVAKFMQWMEQQEELGILERLVVPGSQGLEVPWTNTYIDSAYAKGIRHGNTALRKAGYGSTAIGAGQLLAHPIHADRVGIIHARTYEDLKSVTSVMNAQSRRLIAEGLTTGLARGIAEGKNPRLIAQELYKDVANRVDKIGKVRARMIARTEVLNAHNEAAMAQYERAQAEIGRVILVDISLGANPCEICIGLEQEGPYPLHEARGLVPAHPNCVCVTIPVKRSRSERLAA